MPHHPALVFYIWGDSLHWLWSYCWETARQSFTPNFSEHPVGKTMRWIEKWLAPFNGFDVIYYHGKFGRARTTRASCRCENMVFVCLFFLLPAFTGQKSGFSPHRGDSLHRFTSNFEWPTDTWLHLVVQNFTSIGAGGKNVAPK